MRASISDVCAWCCTARSAFTHAAAQDYPARPIHVVVGFAAGSGADIGVRHVATRMAEIAKATVVVENKPGAGSNIAVGVVANAKPDGYTMLMAASSAMAGSRYLYKDFKIDTEAAFEPVATLWRATFILAVDPKSPIDSVANLTAYLKATPKTLHAYTNQTGQLAAAYYLSQVGATSASVSYRVTPDAVADLNAGSIHFMMIDGAFGSGDVPGRQDQAARRHLARPLDLDARRAADERSRPARLPVRTDLGRLLPEGHAAGRSSTRRAAGSSTPSTTPTRWRSSRRPAASPSPAAPTSPARHCAPRSRAGPWPSKPPTSSRSKDATRRTSRCRKKWPCAERR